MKIKKTYNNQIKLAIENLAINQSVNKHQLIKSIWGEYNHFIGRSFDVIFVSVKKQIISDCAKLQQPIKKFKCRSGKIIRLE